MLNISQFLPSITLAILYLAMCGFAPYPLSPPEEGSSSLSSLGKGGYFDSDRYADMSEACTSNGKLCTEALKKALTKEEDETQRKRLALLLALNLFNNEKFQQAEKVLSKLSGSYDLLEDYIQFYLGESSYKQEKWAEAIPHFEQVPEDSRLYLQARFRIASCMASTKSDGAEQALSELIELHPRHFRKTQAKHELAELIVSKDKARAKKLWIEIQQQEPGTGYGLLAEQRIKQKRLGPIDRETYVDIRIGQVENYIRQYRYDEAGRLIVRTIEEFPDEKTSAIAGKLNYTRGRVNFKMRQYRRAIMFYKKALSSDADKKLKGNALYHLMDARMRKGQTGKTVQGGEWFLKDYPNHARACDAAFLLGRAYSELERYNASVGIYKLLLKRHPDCKHVNTVYWRIAWIHYKHKDWDKALAALDSITSNVPDRFERERARYWMARIAQHRKDGEKAVSIYRSLVESYPLSYYTSLAAMRLVETGTELPVAYLDRRNLSAENIAVDLHQDISAFNKEPHFRKGIEMLRLGRQAEADREFKALSSKANGKEAFYLLKAYFHYLSGDIHLCVNLFRRNLSGFALKYPGQDNRSQWLMAYPRPFDDLFAKYTAIEEIDRWLLTALSREESSFQADVKSSAHAVGLTQIIYRTGRAIARQLKFGRFRLNDLTNPDTAIRFGAHHLKDLVKRFKGNVALAISSYNAGETAVRRWVRERPNTPMDEFIEEIPYKETRRYTRRVLKSYGIYRYLYTDDGVGFKLWATPTKR